MAEKIVNSIFGVDPAMYSQLKNQQNYADALAVGNQYAVPGTMMNPSLGPLYTQAAQQGQLIGGGVGTLLGAQDPELQKITAIKQLSTQFDLTSPTGMREFSRALQQIAPNESMMAAKRADEMTTSALGRQKTQLDITGTEDKQAKQKILEAEIAKLPDNATPEQWLSVYRRFGSPDQQAAAIQRSVDAQANREAKFDLAKEKAALKAESIATQQKAMATDTLESSTEGLALVQNLKKDVNNWTVGLGGYTSWVPMTSSKKFASDLDTLKSRLTLAAMNAAKAQSRTGATGFGALNSKELKVLQDNIVALDTGLSPSDFQKKLDEVNQYFIKLQNKATTTLGGTPSVTVSSANAENDPLGLRK